MMARDGDNLITHFQCDLCHFRNIQRRNPVFSSTEDSRSLELIRRANLDALWSRETTTVAKNLREAIRQEFGFAIPQGLPSVTPPMGPLPLSDDVGMLGAMAVLDRSLDPGRNDLHVQYDTFRGARSVQTNITQAGLGVIGGSVGAYERKKMFISESVTHKLWFGRFMEGVHKRVGQIRLPDEPITIDVLHALERELERDWGSAKTRAERKRVAEIGTWIMAGFCTGLRGEEMPLIDLRGTAKSVAELMGPTAVDPKFKLVIIGRTKGVQQDGAKFAIPCVAVTRGTGLRPGKWVKRLVDVVDRKNGKLFVRALTPAKMMEYEEDFFILLERVQSSTEFIPQDLVVRDAFGLSRSLRRGVTAHARNMRLGTDLINAINRWGREANTLTGAPRMDMQDTYTTLDAIMPLVLEFSRGL